MPGVTVVTDTTQYLPRALLAEYGIELVSLYVNQDGTQSRESEMPDFDGFYERLRASTGALPTTSQPSIGDFLAVYEPILASGSDIVSVHLAGGISGTVEGARQAAAQALEAHSARQVLVVDSDMACGALGAVALAGAAAARRGLDAAGVVAAMEETKKVTRLWFAVDTLEFLRRGGRIGAAQAWLGGALKIKPILTVDREITPIERVRTSGRAFERLVAFAEHMRAETDPIDGWIVQHIQAEDQAQRLADRCREIFRSEPVCVSEIGPVIGTHVGPGLLGVGGLPRRLLG